MNKKRAWGIAVVLYIATFIIGIVTGMILGTDFTGETSIPLSHWIISIILSILITGIFSIWYFKGKKVKVSAKEGLKLGLIYLAVGVLFDLLFLTTFSLSGQDISAIASYYADPLFYVSVVLVVLTPVFIGYRKIAIKHKKNL